MKVRGATDAESFCVRTPGKDLKVDVKFRRENGYDLYTFNADGLPVYSQIEVKFQLPIAEYPEIAPPTVKVTAMYPGATSQVIAETVAGVIEEQVNGIEDLLYFKSESDNNGNYTLTLTFKPGVKSDIAQVNVQNAVQRAEAQLPDIVKQIGVKYE